MSVGLLIVTHGSIGKSILDTALAILGTSPLPTRIMSVPMGCERDKLLVTAADEIRQLDQGDGVLILTDMYGATPCNITCNLQEKNTSIVAGLNLPMLIRVLNYPELDLIQMTEKAISGGQDGVMPCQHSGEP